MYEKSNWIIRMHHVTVFQSHSCHIGSQSENSPRFTTHYMHFAFQTFMKQLISWKTFQKWDKVSLCGGLCSSAVGRGLCGIALPQVKFLGVVEMVPGARQVWFVYILYVTFSYLSLQYHSSLFYLTVSMYIFPAGFWSLHTSQLLVRCTCCYFSALL